MTDISDKLYLNTLFASYNRHI